MANLQMVISGSVLLLSHCSNVANNIVKSLEIYAPKCFDMIVDTSFIQALNQCEYYWSYV